jgi:hypothetical protein
LSLSLSLVLSAALIGGGCAGVRSSNPGGSNGSGSGGGSAGRTGTGGGAAAAGGTRGGGGTGGGIIGTGITCPGPALICAIDKCEGKPKTTIKGTVYDPAGQVPLYNVIVYVPNDPVAEIKTGAACETCASPVSGRPIAVALTNASGQFTMEDAPVGTNIPLVIQIGKWRRQITLPEVKACQENLFSNPDLFRLPRNQMEGHLPKIAMTTGEADSLECLLRRIGVSDSEFTTPDGPGRVNLFFDEMGATSFASGGAYPQASSLWSTVDSLKQYDIVIMSCQGSQAAGRNKTTAHKEALKGFLDQGGRVFVEHYHYSWLRGNVDPGDIDLKYPATPFPPVATWNGSGGDGSYSIDTSFPKGDAFADWLVNVGASTAKGSIALVNVDHPAVSVMAPLAQRWVFNASTTPYFSFNTPLEKVATPEMQCGRFVHTGIHVSNSTDDTEAPFPSGCDQHPLTAQEKALEFLLFDLSSCVTRYDATPVPPPIVP